MLKLQNRNDTYKYCNTLDKAEKINLPVMVVEMASKMRLIHGGDWLSMTSPREIAVRNDMDVLGIIFKEENKQ